MIVARITARLAEHVTLDTAHNPTDSESCEKATMFVHPAAPQGDLKADPRPGSESLAFCQLSRDRCVVRSSAHAKILHLRGCEGMFFCQLAAVECIVAC